MLNQESVIVIVGVCAIVLLIGGARRQISHLITVLLRMVMGTAGIYLLDLLLSLGNITLTVGINLFNMLVVGILGLPGFGLLYAISAIKIL